MKEIDMEIVLGVLEDIVSDDFCHDLSNNLGFDEIKDERLKAAAEHLGRLYRIIHAFNPNNICYGVHEDWRKLVGPLSK